MCATNHLVQNDGEKGRKDGVEGDDVLNIDLKF